MCAGRFDYDKAFANTAEVLQTAYVELNIPADRVVQHYDVCAKNCPSAIRAKNDWNLKLKRFRKRKKRIRLQVGKNNTDRRTEKSSFLNYPGDVRVQL